MVGKVAATLVACLGLASAVKHSTSYVNKTTCNGNSYVYESLAGYGLVASNARDSFGDTLGGWGSGIAIDRSSWKKLANGSYTGTMWTVPDRGWNTEGTLNYQPRVHRWTFTFTPEPGATVSSPSKANLLMTYQSTIGFTGPDGTPATGIDADGSGHLSYSGFPDLPKATYTGDGFGHSGPGGVRIPIDCEGLVLNSDGSFWVSDEYGPYIYHFSSAGKMLSAIRPPDAYIPMRNDTESFSSDNPPVYADEDDDVDPADVDTGRVNNHGFEGLTVSKDGKTLWVLLQAALEQEGGDDKNNCRYARLLQYDVSTPSKPVYSAEYVVPLPLYNDPSSSHPVVAKQSEIHYIGGTQFLVLSHDSGYGHGQPDTESIYRQIDIFDIGGNTTNIKGSVQDCSDCNIASSGGSLHNDINVAEYCPWLDFNVNSQLERFSLHNGGSQDQTLLNEKWESLAIAPVDGKSGTTNEWFLFSASDNDYITQDGFMEGGEYPYTDSSGYDLDVQVLVFQVTLPSIAVTQSP